MNDEDGPGDRHERVEFATSYELQKCNERSTCLSKHTVLVHSALETFYAITISRASLFTAGHARACG